MTHMSSSASDSPSSFETANSESLRSRSSMRGTLTEPRAVAGAVPEPMFPDSESQSPRHILTVAVEEYYHATALGREIERHHRRRLETRLEQNIDRVLDLLGRYEAKATFFVLGSVAEPRAAAIRRITAAGHEVATRTWEHGPISAFDRESLRNDVRRSRSVLEQILGQGVNGFRVAEQRFRPVDYWALDVLAEEGFAYDSSVFPRYLELRREPWRRFPHRHQQGGLSIYEFPLSTWGPDSFLMPFAGGNAFRQLPSWFVRRSVTDWTSRYPHAFNMYFNVWELDPALPRLAIGGWIRRMRLYRNLDRMEELLTQFLEQYRFESIAGHLQRRGHELRIARQEANPQRPDSVSTETNSTFGYRPTLSECGTRERPPLTVIVPCYNEEAVLSYLERTLNELVDRLRPRGVRFVFVDDGSSDGTVPLLHSLFGQRPDARIIEHDHNRGVAAAIMTGIAASKTELVGSMDCDCTYDPLLFADMLEALDEDTALVTTSPYHPAGDVRNVPVWRLFLSKTLSRLYRLLLRNQLYTYTSCFRVYRRSALQDVELRSEGFLGMAEMIAELDLRGCRVREFPAVLESRILGRSKMKTLLVIVEHLGLLRRLVAGRIRRRFRVQPEGSSSGPPT